MHRSPVEDVVVSADDDHRAGKRVELLGRPPQRLVGHADVVEEIAGDEHRIDALVTRLCDDRVPMTVYWGRDGEFAVSQIMKVDGVRNEMHFDLPNQPQQQSQLLEAAELVCIAFVENIKMQFFVEAFNIVNRKQILSYNTTAFSYSNTTDIVPYVTSPASAFGTPFSTSSTLYGPRQLQFTAKLFF